MADRKVVRLPKDTYGLSWRVVPTVLDEMISDPDQDKAQRAMKAMLGMVKLDIAELQRAFDGAESSV